MGEHYTAVEPIPSDPRFAGWFEPYVLGFGFEGWRCRACGLVMTWWDLLEHYGAHVNEIWPEDELTD